MKTIGLLGGTSWTSTPLFYNAINAEVNATLGAFHSAEILLRSIDYNAIKSLYATADCDGIAGLLGHRLKELDALGPDCIVICNNTLHKAYDAIADTLNLRAPVIHLIRATVEAAKDANMRNVLVMGTKLTMEDGFVSRQFEAAGIKADIPSPADRDVIQSIQTALSLGKSDPAFSETFKKMFNAYSHYDAVVLACTELPLAIDERIAGMPVLNTITIGCKRAVAFALG